jgi:hypothetical protein
MSINKLMPAVYFVFGIISAVVAYSLSFKWETGQPSEVTLRLLRDEPIVGAGVDIAADGGALGFALLAGICFFCCAYLLKKKADSQN